MSKSKNYSNKKNYNGNSYGKRSKYTPIEKFAYNMGCVMRGQKNDSRVADSYQAGIVGTTKNRKPLIGK